MTQPQSGRATVEPRIVGLLFADVVSYSKLSNPQVKTFAEVVLPAISALSQPYRSSFIDFNTWGDAIHVASHSVPDLARFALELRDLFQKRHWEKDGLPTELAIRTSLHAAEVWFGKDPIRDKEGVMGGREVSLTARIEPITPPNHVWVTGLFREHAARHDPKLAFDHLGSRPLSKSYGSQELFNLRWTSDRDFDLASLPAAMDSKAPEVPDHFEVCLRDGGGALWINTNSTSPSIDAYLRVSNFTPMAARLTRTFVRVHAQQLLVTAESSRSFELKPYASTDTVFISTRLVEPHVSAADSLERDTDCQLTIELDIVCGGKTISIRRVVDTYPRLSLRPRDGYVLSDGNLAFEVAIRQGALRWDRSVVLCPRCLAQDQLTKLKIDDKSADNKCSFRCRKCGFQKSLNEAIGDLTDGLARQFRHGRLALHASIDALRKAMTPP